MTGPTANETELELTEHEKRHMPQDEQQAFLHPEFEEPPEDAVDAKELESVATGVDAIIDDTGRIEPVDLFHDAFDPESDEVV